MTNYEPYVSPAAELYHFGIRGMKKGQNRYQNPDGTWTEEGLRRRRERERRAANAIVGTGAIGVAAAGIAAGLHRRSNENKSQDQKQFEGALKASNTIGKEGFNIAENIRNTRLEREKEEIKRNMDLSGLSNKELQDYITRKNLEKQYKNLAVEEMEIGKTFTDQVLEKASNAVVIGGSAISVMLGIRKLIYG